MSTGFTYAVCTELLVPVYCYYASENDSVPTADAVAGWLDTLLFTYGHKGILSRIARVECWDDSRADRPSELNWRHPSLYYPGDRVIRFLASYANAGTLDHEVGHHVAAVLCEQIAEGFRAAFGPQDRTQPPGAVEFFQWAAAKGGF